MAKTSLGARPHTSLLRAVADRGEAEARARVPGPSACRPADARPMPAGERRTGRDRGAQPDVARPRQMDRDAGANTVVAGRRAAGEGGARRSRCRRYRGLGGFKELLLGSTATALLRTRRRRLRSSVAAQTPKISTGAARSSSDSTTHALGGVRCTGRSMRPSAARWA